MQKRKFHKFYKQHFDKIYRFVYFRVGGDHELTEDLVSDIFLKAFQGFHKYDESKSRVSWIYTIARNHVYNYYRQSGPRLAEGGQVEIQEEEVSMKVFIDEDRAEKNLEAENLWMKLQELSEEKRALIIMKYLEGYSYNEMAEILEKKPGALRVSTKRALEDLKKLFKT